MIPVVLVEEALVEAMAEAAWNVHASVPWKDYHYRLRPDQRQHYIDNMKAALRVLRQIES